MCSCLKYCSHTKYYKLLRESKKTLVRVPIFSEKQEEFGKSFYVVWKEREKAGDWKKRRKTDLRYRENYKNTEGDVNFVCCGFSYLLILVMLVLLKVCLYKFSYKHGAETKNSLDIFCLCHPSLLCASPQNLSMSSGYWFWVNRNSDHFNVDNVKSILCCY